MKEEKTIEQALKDAAEQAGAKPEEMKTVAVEQVAGIHVFGSDMGVVNVSFDSEEFKRIMDETIKENFAAAALEEIQADHIQAGTKKPIHGTRKRQIEKAKRKGEKSNGKNEPEI